MDFHQLIQALSDDTWRSLKLLLPELMLCATIVLLLLTRVFRAERVIGPLLVGLVGLAAAIAAQAWIWQSPDLAGRQEMFTGLLIYDAVTAYFRVFLLAFAFLLLVLTSITGVPDRDAASDVFTMILGSTLGMCFMASANHLLMVFLAVEMASVPSYALAGMLKGRRQSSEAALKYAVYGAGAAGVMLYGISLLAGVLGTCHLPTMARQLEAMNLTAGGGETLALALGGLMTMVGLAFKLSAVPFHFWCPDVFEGATAEVNAFLSVASKGAALALLVRVVLGLGHVPQPTTPAASSSGQYAAVSVPDNPAGGTGRIEGRGAKDEGTLSIADNPAGGASGAASNPTSPATSESSSLATARSFMARLIAFLAIITCTFGNLAAYGQKNIKRMLAYSTIAHAGYMMMPVAAVLVLLGKPGAHDLAEDAVASILFYVVTYLFMNLGAFAVVAFLRNQLRSENIDDFAGLVHQCPTIVVGFAVILFSLVGLPPLAGFAGKVVIFYSLGNAELWTLLVVAGLNTALSLFYYLRVVKVMTIDPPPPERLPLSFSPLGGETLFVLAMAIPVVLLGILFNDLLSIAKQAAAQLLS